MAGLRNVGGRASRWALETGFLRGGAAASSLYKASEPRLRRYVERRSPMDYDDASACFRGGEMSELVGKNYEKSLRNLWKAELVAPYLGFKDATRLEKKGAADDSHDIAKMVAAATSDEVKRELDERFNADERNAICHIMSAIVHGEAYALYTSASLIPVVTGTGAKIGMAMQVMEEAKHFIVLREAVRTLGGVQPLEDSARILLDNIARSENYTKLFGMNVLVESFATSLFATFAEYPCLNHILPQFHLDESRHSGFVKNYANAGGIPEHITNSASEKRKRMAVVAPALPVVFDYKASFETLGFDVFEFFGKFLNKVTRLAEDSQLPITLPRREFLAQINFLANAYQYYFEPDGWDGFRDYTKMRDNEFTKEITAVERETFGADIFAGLSKKALAVGRKMLDPNRHPNTRDKLRGKGRDKGRGARAA
jgi:hypothetical protein